MHLRNPFSTTKMGLSRHRLRTRGHWVRSANEHYLCAMDPLVASNLGLDRAAIFGIRLKCPGPCFKWANKMVARAEKCKFYLKTEYVPLMPCLRLSGRARGLKSENGSNIKEFKMFAVRS